MADGFASLASALQQGPDGLFEELARQFLSEKRYHELFDTRLMQARRRLGLPLLVAPPIEELPAAMQDAVEAAQVQACREVGLLLLAEKRIPESWMYLRVAGERAAVAAALEECDPQEEEEVEQLVDIALHQGVSPRKGFEWVLKQFGTCSSVTMFERESLNLQPGPRAEISGVLVKHLHKELVDSLKREIDRQEGSEPAGDSLVELMADREWLFLENAYHIDTSHLSMTVRFARWSTDPAVLGLAYELTEYGRRLSTQFQYEGEDPFRDVYPSHGLFFEAQLGRRVDGALAYFLKQASELKPEAVGLLPVESYVVLLERLGRHAEAFDAAVRLSPVAPSLGFASPLVDLARRANALPRLLALYQERGDRLSYSAILILTQP